MDFAKLDANGLSVTRAFEWYQWRVSRMPRKKFDFSDFG